MNTSGYSSRSLFGFGSSSIGAYFLAMEIRVLSQGEQLEEIESCWRQLHLSAINPELCSSWEWLYSWWLTYQEKDWQLQVICVYAGQRLIAVAPYYYRGERSSRTLCLMGKGEPEEQEVCSEFVDLIVATGFQDEVIQLLAAYQEKEFRFVKKIELKQIEEDSLIAKLWVLSGFRICSKSCGIRYQLPLQSDLRDTLKSLPSNNLKKKTMRLLNHLRSERYNVKIFDTPDQFDDAWSVLENLHSERWASKGKSGAFISDKFRQFHKKYFQMASTAGEAKILTISGDKISAAIYCFYFKDRIYYYQSGFDSKESGSLGIIAHLAVLDATSTGFKKYDFMCGGHQSYKSGWAREQSRVVNVDAYPRTLIGQIRYWGYQLVGGLRVVRSSFLK
ncbi:MAG: GNAT family N-acetyltransferase [Motiliproteus sp.]